MIEANNAYSVLNIGSSIEAVEELAEEEHYEMRGNFMGPVISLNVEERNDLNRILSLFIA